MLTISVIDGDGNESQQPIGKGTSSRIALTRPANTTAYTAGDVVGPAAAAIDFGAYGLVGGSVLVRSAQLLIESSALISGEAGYDLHLYNTTPPSALADNAPFTLASGDWPYYLGKVSFAAPTVIGAALVAQLDGINRQVGIGFSNQDLFGYLVTVGAYTPTSARKYNVTLHAEYL